MFAYWQVFPLSKKILSASACMHICMVDIMLYGIYCMVGVTVGDGCGPLRNLPKIIFWNYQWPLDSIGQVLASPYASSEWPVALSMNFYKVLKVFYLSDFLMPACLSFLPHCLVLSVKHTIKLATATALILGKNA